MNTYNLDDDSEPEGEVQPMSDVPVMGSQDAQDNQTTESKTTMGEPQSPPQPPHTSDTINTNSPGADLDRKLKLSKHTSLNFPAKAPVELPLLGSGLQDDFDHRKPWTRYPPGYPRFAAFIANDEDKSTTIFRRFQRLSARNLLYLESELADLEEEQDRLDRESQLDPDLRLSMKSWDLLCLQATPIQPDESEMEDAEEEEKRQRVQVAAEERLRLAWRIREVLKTYHEALKRESEVLAFDAPDRRPLKGTRHIFVPSYDKRAGTGSGGAMIHGTMRTHLDEANKQDLCVLSPPVEQDRLTRLLEGRLSYFFRTRTADGLSDFVSHKRVSIAVSVISGILAILFLLGAVLGLYWVRSPNAKLGMLSGLTVGFAISLALFTNARRQDVFASTAAYAAVLVVFISGNLSTNSSGSNATSSSSPASSVVTSTVMQTATHFVTATSTLTTAIASSTSTAAATGGGGLPTSSKIALGVGIGLGIPSISMTLIGVWLMIRRKKPYEPSAHHPTALPSPVDMSSRFEYTPGMAYPTPYSPAPNWPDLVVETDPSGRQSNPAEMYQSSSRI